MPRAPLLAALLVLAPSGCGDPASDRPVGGGDEDEAATEAPSGPRTVVIVSLDTLRPERLEVYGGPEGNSPALAAFAEDALVFDQALAPSPWTLPSHMTMLTGLDPIAHGVRNSSYALAEDADTLAERLARAGFETGAFTDGGYVSGQPYGFDAGFDVYEDDRATDGGPNGWERLLPDALAWIEDVDEDEDAFVFLHTFDAHAPYQEGDEEVLARFRERAVEDGPRDHELHALRYVRQQERMRVHEYARLDEVLRDYDAGVFEADRGVGRVLDLLRELGRYDEALVIVTSDHGESFFDHDLHVGHGLRLTDAELGIPLLVKFPDGTGAGRRSDAAAGLIDLVPTVLEVLGLPRDETLLGHDLRELAARGRRPDPLLGVSQNLGDVLSLVWNGYKYVSPMTLDAKYITKRHLGPRTPDVLAWMDDEVKEYETGTGETLRYDFKADVLGLQHAFPWREQLYERDGDPYERRDLAQARPDVLERMRDQVLASWHRSFALHEALRAGEDDEDGGDDDDAMSPTMKKMLEQLGYAHAGGDVVDASRPPTVGGTDFRPLRWQMELGEPPDVTLLVEGARLVHAVRLAVADGEPISRLMTTQLQQALDKYRAWMREPDNRPVWRQRRALWRISELAALAQAAGLPVTPEQLAKGQVLPGGRAPARTAKPAGREKEG